VLVAGGGLDGRDDLPRDAELGERAERRVLVDPVVPDRLVEADEALLDEVVRIAAGDEIARGAEADEARVAADDLRLACAVPRSGAEDEIQILNFTLSLVRLTA